MNHSSSLILTVFVSKTCCNQQSSGKVNSVRRQLDPVKWQFSSWCQPYIYCLPLFVHKRYHVWWLTCFVLEKDKLRLKRIVLDSFLTVQLNHIFRIWNWCRHVLLQLASSRKDLWGHRRGSVSFLTCIPICTLTVICLALNMVITALSCCIQI